MKKTTLLTLPVLAALLTGCASLEFSGSGHMSIQLSDEQEMKFVWIPALHGWCGKYEVTNGEYRSFRPDHDSGESCGHSLNGDRQPVVQVNRDDAQAFIDWIETRCVLPPGYELKLPSQEEWMTVAECGDGRDYPWGAAWPPPNNWNYHGAEGALSVGSIEGHRDAWPVSCPVENSGRNDWGLYGVGGNVWELTDALYKNGKYVLRGAHWGDTAPRWLRCDRRLTASDDRSSFGGFRLFLLPKSAKQWIDSFQCRKKDRILFSSAEDEWTSEIL